MNKREIIRLKKKYVSNYYWCVLYIILVETCTCDIYYSSNKNKRVIEPPQNIRVQLIK